MPHFTSLSRLCFFFVDRDLPLITINVPDKNTIVSEIQLIKDHKQLKLNTVLIGKAIFEKENRLLYGAYIPAHIRHRYPIYSFEVVGVICPVTCTAVPTCLFFNFVWQSRAVCWCICSFVHARHVRTCTHVYSSPRTSTNVCWSLMCSLCSTCVTLGIWSHYHYRIPKGKLAHIVSDPGNDGEFLLAGRNSCEFESELLVGLCTRRKKCVMRSPHTSTYTAV